MKSIVSFCAFACAALPLLGFDVTSVTARQRLPWNQLMDIDVTLSGTAKDAEYRVDVTATSPSITTPVRAKTLLTEPIVSGDGTHRLVWNVGADLPNLRSDGFVVQATVSTFDPTDGVYLVVDLSGGPTATNYPHRYTTAAPDLTSDTCRTTELWLRRCPAGSFWMGDPELSYHSPTNLENTYYSVLPGHAVRISKPFYIGIFELTQGQFAQWTGEWPSYFSLESDRATRPLENQSCVEFRSNAGWYDTPVAISKSSKLYPLAQRSGLAFDLPTDAQWEYACKAGTSGRYYLPAMTADNIYTYARVNYPEKSGISEQTAAADGGTAKVGSYAPNPWGLYDMYGNVFEYTPTGNPFGNGKYGTPPQTKWFPYTLANPLVDPRGPTQEWADDENGGKLTYADARTARSCAWNTSRPCAESMLRYRLGSSTAGKDVGFRLIVQP